MRQKIIITAFLIALSILTFDVYSKNLISKYTKEVVSKVSYPLFVTKKSLEDFFTPVVKKNNIQILGENPNIVRVLSYDGLGVYVTNLTNKGIVLSTDLNFVGFVEKTGKYGYVKFWWNMEFPVIIESSEVSTVGFYSKYKIEILDPIDIKDGTVYLADDFPYARLLRNLKYPLGELRNGSFVPNLPKNIDELILLKDYRKGVEE